ncbi:MAG: hypothetical protein HY744_23005 [Deltaproteobacteria bacterium]|nr:hypothetical protein [Deltaproteobacteria bacterium]
MHQTLRTALASATLGIGWLLCTPVAAQGEPTPWDDANKSSGGEVAPADRGPSAAPVAPGPGEVGMPGAAGTPGAPPGGYPPQPGYPGTPAPGWPAAPYPPQAGGPWAAPGAAAPPPQEPQTVTREGIPLGYRGGFAIDAAGFASGRSDALSVAAAALALTARVRLYERTFLEPRLPFGFRQSAEEKDRGFVLGNPSLAGQHVLVLTPTIWLALGGGFGLPVLSRAVQADAVYAPLSYPNGVWNLHEYYPDIVPVFVRAGLETHFGQFLLRVQANPVLYVPSPRTRLVAVSPTTAQNVRYNANYELAFEHAAELQYGHEIGGGLRVQGVALPTFAQVDSGHPFGGDVAHDPDDKGDFYHFSIEPFFAVERELLFLRLGLMMPINRPVGPPFDQSWGLRLTTGLHVD